MQVIQRLQVGYCRDLQEFEVIFAKLAEIGDVAKEVGAPVVILANIIVDQQVIPPSERACTFYCLKSWATSH